MTPKTRAHTAGGSPTPADAGPARAPGAELRFTAMESTGYVRAVGRDQSLCRWAVRRITALQRRWSRFVPAGEISRLNRAVGAPVIVSAETFELISKAKTAWELTGGAFDPTVPGAPDTRGHDRSPGRVADGTVADAAGPTTGCAGFVLDPVTHAVWIPDNCSFDPGSIGRGLAADIVTRELRRRGAAGALVAIGGDLAISGRPPRGDRWVIGIDHPLDSARDVEVILVEEGGIATSTPPARHQPPPTRFAQVTVLTGSAWWAEALVKAVHVTGSTAVLRNAAAVVVDHNGRTEQFSAA